MKKLTTISLFIFWMVMTAILSASLFYYQTNKDNQKNSSFISGLNNSVAPGAIDFAGSKTIDINTASKTLSMEEVAKHNNAKDCWLVIEGKIYSVSSYIAAHPGGAGTIIPTCGTDSTKAYNTKNEGSSHSKNAHALLAGYYIGNLNQETTVQQVKQNVQTTNTITPPASAGDEDEGGGEEGEDD